MQQNSQFLKLIFWRQEDDFDRGQTEMVSQLDHLQNGRSCGVFLVYSGQYALKVVQGKTSGELTTGSWVPKAH